MGTKMLRGPSLKSLSLLSTFYLPQIMILPDSELKLNYLKTSFFENFETQKLSSPRVFNIFEWGFH